MAPESLAEFIEAVAACVAAGRLLYLGFARRQPGLLTFLIYKFVYLLTLSGVPQNSAVYFWVYIVANILDWFVTIYVVREMFALALDAYPGIRTAGRWTMYGATGFAVAASLAATRIFWRGSSQISSHLYYVEVANRSVVFSLAVIVISILLFLSRYPLHLHRNTYVSTCFFSAVFLSEAAATLIDSLNAYFHSRAVDTAQLLFAAVCFTGWAVMLRPETATESSRISFESPEEHELLLELESLNRLLSRAGRR